MKKSMTFKTPDNSQTSKTAFEFFKKYGFSEIKNTPTHLLLKQKSSWLDAWKANPIRWGSEVSVMISQDCVHVTFEVDTEAQMNTAEEKAVWLKFAAHFRNYLKGGSIGDPLLNRLIADNRKARWRYWGWALLGAFMGALLISIFALLRSENMLMGSLLIPVTAVMFLKLSISYEKRRYGKRQQKANII
ncbi:hypothetical protein ABDK00_000035 [Niabella insulamsoli]|uniref:hypothetical protein n=1 Tax=Niabella insulamsoli TaxID=3144874 RepID=UPI0031FD12CD